MTSSEWALLLALSLLWGGSFFFNGIAIKALPVFTVVAARVFLAAVLLWAVLPLAGVSMPRDRGTWTAFLGMGMLNNVIPFCLIVWGQAHIASGVASILNATTPLFGVVVAHLLTADEKMSGGKLAGVALGVVGVCVMVGGEAVSSLTSHVAAELACLAGALSYALAGVYGRRFRALGASPIATATGQVTISSLLLVPIAAIVDQPWTLAPPGAAAISALIGVAVLSTALGYILYFRILATAGATNLLLVTFLIPVTAIGLGVFALGETLAPRHVLGMALIGLGLAAIDGRPLRSFAGLARAG
jgi:drug/metabolite transporter (DMT)-like permease